MIGLFLNIYIILILCLFSCQSKYIEGELYTLENWAFVARFCFLSEEGRFQYTIEYGQEYAIQNLLLYYDTDTQWPAVYKSNKTCWEREAVMVRGQNQVVSLSPKTPFLSGCTAEDNGTFVCQNERRFRSARERWWFLAISNCNTTKGLNMRYKFLMTNGPPEDYWRHHFSADEFYILPLLMIFLFMYFALLFAVFVITVELKSRQLLHTTYKQFAVSVLLQTFGIIMQGVAYARFATDGIGFPTLRTFGRLLEAASENVFVLLLLLLAQGYTITRGRIKLGAAVRLTTFMCLYCAAQIALYAWESQLFDPGEVLYLYESPVGHGLAALRMIAWARALLSTAQTVARGPHSKAGFYKRFAILVGFWFISMPLMVLAASFWVDKWVRETVVCGVAHTIMLAGHLAFGVGVMASSVSEDSSDCSFAEHNYAPSALMGQVAVKVTRPPHSGGDWASHVPVDLFTVSQAISSPQTNKETPPAAVFVNNNE